MGYTDEWQEAIELILGDIEEEQTVAKEHQALFKEVKIEYAESYHKGMEDMATRVRLIIMETFKSRGITLTPIVKQK